MKTILWILIFIIFTIIMVVSVLTQNGLLQLLGFVFLGVSYHLVEQKKILSKFLKNKEPEKINPKRNLIAIYILFAFMIIAFLIGLMGFLIDVLVDKNFHFIWLGISSVLAVIYVCFKMITKVIPKYKAEAKKISIKKEQ